MFVCVHLREDHIKNAISLPIESECVDRMAYFQGSRVMKDVKAQFLREQSRCGKSRALCLSKVRINSHSLITQGTSPQNDKREGTKKTFQA